MTNSNIIRVLHFDYQRFFSTYIRERLALKFKKYPKVEYYDFISDHYGSFEENKETLEALLPQKDILLIYPSVIGQKRVFEYLKLFPHLQVALVIPGDFSTYESMNGIRLFDYTHTDSIVNWVLSGGKEIK